MSLYISKHSWYILFTSWRQESKGRGQRFCSLFVMFLSCQWGQLSLLINIKYYLNKINCWRMSSTHDLLAAHVEPRDDQNHPFIMSFDNVFFFLSDTWQQLWEELLLVMYFFLLSSEIMLYIQKFRVLLLVVDSSAAILVFLIFLFFF